jgi:hypothetical protein
VGVHSTTLATECLRAPVVYKSCVFWRRGVVVPRILVRVPSPVLNV